jgi:hypothetical protein
MQCAIGTGFICQKDVIGFDIVMDPVGLIYPLWQRVSGSIEEGHLERVTAPDAVLIRLAIPQEIRGDTTVVSGL